MCGIFGGIGPDFNIQTVKLLAVLNEARGKDSCGFWNKDFYWKQVGLVRSALTSLDQKKQEGYLLGHTRQATRGAVTKDNSHPFNYAHIWGGHNGVIYNFTDLCLKYPKQNGRPDMEVDSQMIFWGLSKFGFDFFKEVEGYWGLAWTDSRHADKIYLMSHDATVHLSVSKKKKAIYYSSDDAHLIAAGCEKPFKLKDDFIYIIDTVKCTIEKTKVGGIPQWSYNTKKNKRMMDYSGVDWGDKFGEHDSYSSYYSTSYTTNKEITEGNTEIIVEKENKEEVKKLSAAEWDRYLELEDKYDHNTIELKELDEYEQLSNRAYKQTGVKYPANEAYSAR